MGAFVNTSALKSPTGLLKILNLCLAIIVLVLAKAGWKGDPVGHISDPLWLTSIAAGGFVLILSCIIVSYILGDLVAYKLEALFMFIGTILYLAFGSLAIEKYQGSAIQYSKDTGLALGSMAIITGIFMFVDFLLLLKAIFKK